MAVGQPACGMAPWPVTLLPIDVDGIAPRGSSQSISTGNAQMAEGIIRKLIDRGYGFIKTESDKDLFFH